MTDAKQPSPWLVDAAVRSGAAAAARVTLDAKATPVERWAAVARAAGLTTAELAVRVAAQFHLPVAALDAAEPRAQALIPEKLARRHLVFPLRETDRQLAVAVWDPTDLDAERQIGFASGRTPKFEIAPPGAIQDAIDGHYAPDRLVENLLDRVGSELGDDVRVLEQTGPEVLAAQELEGAPVVKLTGLILADAVREGASDIHLEPGREGGMVRFRVDGVLRPYMPLPMAALNRVVSRIKIMGKLDIADRLRPQDGRTRVQIQQRTFDLRLSTVPTREAEKAVIRVLDPTTSKRIDDLQLPPHELARFRRLLGHRDGIAVVTGPTGSGKTTTLYAALRELATGKVNIMTVEDPVEYELPGLTQIQVEPKRGVTFAASLRSILRQDPDVIFVGEIRDLETAEVAVQAALTGHLVLATLHANDAVGAITRFADLGLERAKIASTLRGAVAQRLLRRACAACAVRITGPLTPDEERLAALYGVRPVMRAVGCL
ncbi:MAG TPA: GspE/PulE family protein, partial [Gemmatimonadales bacterium]